MSRQPGGWADLSKVELRWLPRALEHCRMESIDPSTAEGAARYPDHITIDPSTKLLEGRWPAERRRRGDVTVVVGFPPQEAPVIWGVYYNLPLPHKKVRQNPGGAGGHTLPTSMREVRKRIIEAGCVIKSGGHHDRAETPDGRFLAALPITPSDHRTIPNLVRDLARKGIDITR